MVALGLNIVLLVNLALVNLARSASVWAVVLQRRRPVAALERWETGYLPVFPVWAAVVAVLVPPLFAFAWVWGGAPSSARAWVGPLGAHTRDRFLNLGRPALHHLPLPSRSMRAIVGPSAARRTVVKGVATMGAPQLTSEEPSGHPRERLLALTAAALALVMGIVAGVTIAVGGEPPASRDEDAKNAGGVAAAAAAPEHDPLVVDRSTIGGLRLGLEQLLGYDAVVTARLVEARVRDDDDVARVIETVLQHNTSDLAGLVGSIYGADAGSTLQQLWESRTAAAGEYATAVADGDTAEVPSAREGLRESSQEVAEFLGATSSGAVPADVLASGQWVDHITALVDAYAAGRYAEGLALVHDTHELAFSVARGLAAGLWSQQAPLPPDFDAPAQQLRSGLGLLLGEHTQLAVDVTRSGLAGLEDFDAVTAALDDNTERLRSALEAVGGPGAGATFSTLWAHHVEALVAFTRAVAEEDEADKQAALDHMQAFSRDMAAFLESATEGRLTGADLTVAVGQHDRLLLAQVEAYHAQDYGSAFTLSTEAYRHAVALGAQTGEALAATVAARAPQGAPQTGLGGTARDGVRP